MSINVETIGDSLLVQHYIGEIAQPHHCRMVSLSDVFGPLGRTTSHVVWELKVEPFDETRSEYVSHLTATATDELLALLDEHGIAFEQAAAARDEAAAAHNARETPRFAHSIEQRALPRRDRRNPN